MKKFILLLGVMSIGLYTCAQDTLILGSSLASFKNQKGISENNVVKIGQKILIENKISKRVPILIDRKKMANAESSPYDKIVTVHEGILFYLDNEDELAFILSHEIAHSVEAYGGMAKYIAMNANSKKYEQKADLNGIDYMVKAGYDPIAAITIANKLFGEPIWDWGFAYTHPKGSKRLIDMYKYIYVKYPKYLNSPLTNSPSYKNFEFAMSKEISSFQQKQKRKQMKDNL